MLKLIVVGCGRVFERYHLPAVRAARDVRIVGVADPSPDRREWAGRILDGVPSFASAEALLEEVTADAVLIASPPESHAPIAHQVLPCGLPVLIEKPMALCRQDAQRICDLQQIHRAAVRVGFNRRFRAGYADIRARLGNGAPRVHVRFQFTAGAARWRPAASTASTPVDVLHDAGSHGFDLIAFVVGQPIVRVRAVAEQQGAACVVKSQLQLDNGSTATCSVAHAPRFQEHLSVECAGNLMQVDVSGVTRSARARSAAELIVRRLLKRPTPTDQSFRRQLADFKAACRGDSGTTGADAHDGYRAVSAVEACLKSLKNGNAWQDVYEDSITY